jgi:hypothetical protein
MNWTETRGLVALVLPYALLVAVLCFALRGVEETLLSLIAGGALAAIDPRRGQSQPTTTVTTGTPPEQTTVTTGEPASTPPTSTVTGAPLYDPRQPDPDELSEDQRVKL